MRVKMKKSYIELFAGVGGFRLAFDSAEWDLKWSNQWEPVTKKQHAFDVYVRNFGEDNAFNLDIQEVEIDSIPKHNLLVGGFPCQDYSVARTKAEGIQGKKGVLWWSISKIINFHRTPFLFLENVDRLIKSPNFQKGRDFGVILYDLYKQGYDVEWRVIDASKYGFPQKRKRLYILAYNKITNFSNKNFSELDSGFFESLFPVIEKSDNNFTAFNKYKDILDVSENFYFQFHNAGFTKNGNIYTWKFKEKESELSPLLDILESNVSQSHFITKQQSEKIKNMKSAKSIGRVSKATGFKYNYSEGKMDFPDNVNRPGRTILTSEGSINRSTHVIEDKDNKKLRKLTSVECERLNGFPDNWTKYDIQGNELSFSRRNFLMGNALVVGLVKIVAEKLADEIKSEFGEKS